jgi:hypothetical protein
LNNKRLKNGGGHPPTPIFAGGVVICKSLRLAEYVLMEFGFAGVDAVSGKTSYLSVVSFSSFAK